MWPYLGIGALITPINHYTQLRVREWAETHGSEFTRKHICRMSDNQLKALEEKIDDKNFPKIREHYLLTGEVDLSFGAEVVQLGPRSYFRTMMFLFPNLIKILFFRQVAEKSLFSDHKPPN